MTIEEFIKKHKPLSLYIEYNDHKSSYETVKEYIEEREITDEEIIDKEECIKNDTIYSLQIYPITPIGFYLIHSSSLEKAIDEMDKYFSKEKENKDE